MTTKQKEDLQRRVADLDNHWHLDKRIPIAIVFAFILQTIYFTVFITKLDSRVAVLEDDKIEIRKTIQDMAEIRVHQEYILKDLEKLDKFLRDDVEWVKPKKRSTR